MRNFTALVLAFAIAGFFSASAAHANHIFGATYTGTHSGDATAGEGTVEFTVGGNGSYVTSFGYTNLPIGCGLHLGAPGRPVLALIANHAFSYTGSGAGSDRVSFSGTFSGLQSATGTLTWIAGSPCGEASPRVTWTATTTAPPVADLSVEVRDSPDPVLVGRNLVYTTSVTNPPAEALGSSSAPGVILTETLPSGATFVSASATQGTCTQSSGGVTCSLGTISSGGGADVTVVVIPTRAGQITLSATVATDARDPVPANNSARQQTIVQSPCVVPKVVGKLLSAAKRAISRAHCRTGAVTRVSSRKVAKNRVVSQKPAPGTQLASLARVSLVVSRGAGT